MIDRTARAPNAVYTPGTLRVLLFEDNAMDAALMRKLLTSTGVRSDHIHHADSIPSALHTLARADVHVCLADYFLRPHTGFDLMDEAKRAGVDVPFIMVSALDDRDVDEGARVHGAYAFLVKADLTVENLERSIRYALARHARENELSRTAHLDTLTGLSNRQAFVAHLTEAVADKAPRAGLVGVAVFDLKDTADLNRELGHEAADDVLRTVARRLTAARQAGDIVARVGGDEFAMVMDDLLLASQARERAQRVLETAAGAVETAAGVHSITLACGVASQTVRANSNPATIAERLFERASQGCSAAKAGCATGVSQLVYTHLH